MGRSKEMGKPVDELTPTELRSELQRYRTLVAVYGQSTTGKTLRKRLLQIERRLEREGEDPESR